MFLLLLCFLVGCGNAAGSESAQSGISGVYVSEAQIPSCTKNNLYEMQFSWGNSDTLVLGNEQAAVVVDIIGKEPYISVGSYFLLPIYKIEKMDGGYKLYINEGNFFDIYSVKEIKIDIIANTEYLLFNAKTESGNAIEIAGLTGGVKYYRLDHVKK